MIRTRLASALFALLLLAACKGAQRDPQVTQAWVRLPAVAGQPAAAYFNILGGGRDDRLVRIETAVAQRVDLHASMTGMHRMATMVPLDHVDIPRRATIRFAPGGTHAMIIALDRRIVPGTAVPLRFGFASGKTAEAEAKTVSVADASPY